jgi:hypothetical protein
VTVENYTGASLAINQYALKYEDLPFRDGLKVYEHGKLYRSRLDSQMVYLYNLEGDKFDIFHWRYE